MIGRCGDVQHEFYPDYVLAGEGDEKKKGRGDEINKLHISHLLV